MSSGSRLRLAAWLPIAALYVAATAAATPTLWLQSIPEPGLAVGDQTGRELLDIEADPRGGGFLATTRDHEIVTVGSGDRPAAVPSLRTRGGDFGIPAGLFPQLDGVAVTQVALRRTAFFDARLDLVTALPWNRASCNDGPLRLRPDRILCLGPPIVPAEGSERRWDDSRWRRANLRLDCRLFIVDPGAPEVQAPLFCDGRLDSPVGRGLPGGHALQSLDGERIYAVLEALPELIVLDSAGDVLRRESFLEAGEVFPRPTQAEVDRQYASADAALAFRNRFDWPVGLLRWGAAESRETHAVAIVFRRWAGTRPIFVADLFSAEGEKLADDLPLVDPEVPPLQDSAFVSAAPAPDGRSFLLVGDRRSGDRRLLGQRLYEVVLDGLADAGRALRVSVRDDRGPVPDAHVVDVEAREAFLTDASGIARLVDRPSTPFALEVRAADHIDRELWVQPDDRQLDIELDRGSGFRVRLLDPLGAPIGAARVRPYQGGRFHTLDRRVDADGTVEVAGLGSGEAELTFLVDGFRAARLTVDLPVAGQVADLGDLWLDRGGVVEGRLVGADGAPAEGAVVEAHRPSRSGRIGAEYHGDLLTDTTGVDGRFRVSGLEPGDVCVRARHHRVAVLALDIPALGDGAIRDLGDLDLGPGSRLLGRVEDADGRPLAGESVELRAGDTDDPCWRSSATSDAKGCVTFDGVAPGAWSAVVRRDGQVVARRAVAVEPRTDEPVDLGALVIRDRRVAGRITIGGLAVAGGGVSLEPLLARSPPTPLFVAETGRQRLINDRPIALGASVDADGRFVIRGVLPPGTAVLTYRSPDGDAFRRLVELPPAGPLDLALDFVGVDLAGVARVDGRPAAGARLELHYDDLAVRETVADSGGRFRLPAAPAAGVVVARLGALVGEARVASDRVAEIDLAPR